MPNVKLTDVVRAKCGYPVDMEMLIEVLDIADRELPNGRDCQDSLTDEQLALFGLSR